MTRHLVKAYVAGLGGEGEWQRIGETVVTDTIVTSVYQSDTDTDLIGVRFLVEDVALGRFYHGGVRLSFVHAEIALRQQIDALNDDPRRPHFRFVAEAAVLYVIGMDEMDDLVAHGVRDLLALGPVTSAVSWFPHHPYNGVAEQVQRVPDVRQAVARALGKALPTGAPRLAEAPWNQIGCALAYFDDERNDTLGEQRDLSDVLPAPPLEGSEDDAVLVLYVKAPAGTTEPEDTRPPPGWRDAVDNTAALPLTQPAVPCVEVDTPPLMLVPDFCTSKRRLYTVYHFLLNHNVVFDLAVACSAAHGTVFTADPAEELAEEASGLVLLPPPFDSRNFFNEVFLQDRYLPACIWNDRWTRVQVSCAHKCAMPRLSGTERIHRLEGKRSVEQNYGGNFIVSPPVPATGPITPFDGPMGQCGPAVPAQDAAPFGKIVVGDCSTGFKPRTVDDTTRRALWQEGRGAQPWLPVDVSWLSVGHTDEIVSFFINPAGKHKMVLVSTTLMHDLLALLAHADNAGGRCKFNVGQWGRGNDNRVAAREIVGPKGTVTYCELAVPALQQTEYRVANKRLQAEKLDPIARRLAAGLAIGAADTLSLPVYFGKTYDGMHDAATPNVVNLQMINGHLLLPRPYGPRMRRAAASTILSTLLGHTVTVPPCSGFWHWGFPGEYLLRIALYYLPLRMRTYTADMDAVRCQLIRDMNMETGDIAGGFSAEMGPAMEAAELFAAKIMEQPQNAAVTAATQGAMPTWQRVWIPLPCQDIVEELILATLAAHGVPREQVHFIDSWAYHRKSGNIHCATNALADVPGEWGDPPDEWFNPRQTPPFPYRP